jgi:ferredoxin/flavodoxin---NADP+ reductase
MSRICNAAFIPPDIKRFVIDAPRIAHKRKAGQFVIVRIHERGERIPLTIVDADQTAGTITLIVQGVGKTTRELNKLEAGDDIQDVVGPLGISTARTNCDHSFRQRLKSNYSKNDSRSSI